MGFAVSANPTVNSHTDARNPIASKIAISDAEFTVDDPSLLATPSLLVAHAPVSTTELFGSAGTTVADKSKSNIDYPTYSLDGTAGAVFMI